MLYNLVCVLLQYAGSHQKQKFKLCKALDILFYKGYLLWEGV
jgi:hypothetical protein